MAMTHREFWTAVHGMVLGAGFLLLFTGTLAGLWMLKANWLTPGGARSCARWTAAAAWTMALLAFAAAFAGTYVVYPWYRAVPPHGVAGVALASYPKFFLLANPQTADWHEFGMEWKEHIAWLAPMLSVTVAYGVTRLGSGLADQPRIRRALVMLLTFSFFCAAVAGALGALINKAAPTR